MSKWKPKDRVVVTTADGPVETMGDVYGIWAVTAWLRLDGTFCTDLFGITHVPSGRLYHTLAFTTVRKARFLAKALAKGYPTFHLDGSDGTADEGRKMRAFLNLLLATDKVAP